MKGKGNSYNFGARIYDPRISRWLSLDPLQNKYPSLTPYHFVANTPIQAIELDGKDFIILGSKEYRAKVEQLIRDLYNQSPTAREAILKITSSDKIFLISETPIEGINGNAYNSFGTSKSEGLLTFNFTEAEENYDAANGRNGQELEANALSTFAHELGHLIDDYNGIELKTNKIYNTNKVLTDQDGNKSYVTLVGSEPGAVKFENKVRGELGMGLRTHYRGFNVFNKRTSDEPSKSPIGEFTYTLENDSYDYSQHNTQNAVRSNLDQVFIPGKYWDARFKITRKEGGYSRYGYAPEKVKSANKEDGETRITTREP